MLELPEHSLSDKPYFNEKTAWTAFLNFVPEFQQLLQVPADVYVHDCTLRDGEQAPGVVFSIEEKVLIATMLDEIGVKSIEMGLPMVDKDRAAIKRVTQKPHRARIMALTRANSDDIDKASDLGLDGLVIEHSINPYTCKFAYQFGEEELIRKNVDAINYAKNRGFLVNWMGWDAFRVDISYVERVFKSVVAQSNPEIITIADTFGMVHPLILFEFFKKMRSWFPDKRIEYHAHNDYGMATANAVTAVLGGANAVHTAINGLGERAGNIPLEEFAVNMKNLFHIDTGIRLQELNHLSNICQQISKFPIAPNKPIVGSNLFNVESGMIMHIFINAAHYQFPPTIMLPFMPEQVGQKDLTYVLSKGSGKATVEFFLQKLGYSETSAEMLDCIIDEVKYISTVIKGPLNLEDFATIVKRVMKSEDKELSV